MPWIYQQTVNQIRDFLMKLQNQVSIFQVIQWFGLFVSEDLFDGEIMGNQD